MHVAKLRSSPGIQLGEGPGTSGTQYLGEQQARCHQRQTQWRLRQGFLRFTTGWRDRFAVTPDKLSAAPAGTLTAAGSVTNGVQIPFATFINPGALNLRSGATTWYSRIATIPTGTKFKAYETGNGWTRVKYGSHEGWVSSPLINKVATIDPATIATNI